MKKTLWEDGRVPSDRSQIIKQRMDTPRALFIIFSTVASFGIVLGIIFMVFNRYYRDCKFISLSVPMFNDIIVLGCIMCLSTIYLFGIRKVNDANRTMPRICKARAWLLNIGFSLAFGAMFIKTWRVYKIYTNIRMRVGLGLSDWRILAMVFGIVVIDVVLLVAWELTDPLQHEETVVDKKNDPGDHHKMIISTINTCTGKNVEMWLALIYVSKGILLLYGLFLAYETRNVVYAHLNDSRIIGICVYNVVVLSTIGAFLALILKNEQYVASYSALSVCISFPAATTISLIFIPKLIHRLKTSSVDGETVGNQNRAGRPTPPGLSSLQGANLGIEIKVLGRQ
ncbi:gamma-aminobutyric acid type B receptor subunit 2-like [Porites lutea]|uniref:gamma-aminobutyric acid type B receptor subunit 2-like n=1 Tax=Porites lutea TaxID=51062 RepID=UPI003CC5C0AB